MKTSQRPTKTAPRRSHASPLMVWLVRLVVVAMLLSTLPGLGAPSTAYADVPDRVPPTGSVPNPGTQQQELANITAPAPYNVFEFTVTCAGCHGGGIDQTAGHFSNWAGTSMASSARDPFFRANQIGVNNAVRSALLDLGLSDAEANGAGNMCFRCHSPNGWYSGRFDPNLNGDPEGSTMMHSIVLSTDDEGILCEACHRTTGNVTMQDTNINPSDPVWNMLALLKDWPHAGSAYVDQAGDPTIASGNPYGDTTLQLNDGMDYIGKYSGIIDLYTSDVPADGTPYTGQMYGVYPDGWTGPKNPVPAGLPATIAGKELAYASDGSLPPQFEAPIGPPVDSVTGQMDFMAQSISLEHPTIGSREDGMLPSHVPAENTFIRSSEFCGTCHDLTVPVLNHGMPEQRTYTEWKFSEFGDGDGQGDARCQDCHMPTMKHEFADDAPISVNADPALSGYFPYAKDRNEQGGTAFHKFAGANRDLPMAMKLLYPEPDLEVIGAPTSNDPRVFPGMLSTRDPMYDRNQRNSEVMLNDAVVLEIMQEPTYVDGRWQMQVKLTNTAGHRIPSGYPDGRRFWLEVEVTDAANNVVYESGAYDENEAQLYTDSSLSGFNRALEPVIDEAQNAVMVYERVTASCDAGHTNCVPSPSLLNQTILFDNRILAADFDYASLREAGVKFWNYDPATMTPYEDMDRYAAGQNWDVVTYIFDAPPDAQLTARAEVYWQTHTREFVEHLRTQDASTVRPQGGPNILDPNYPLTPNYLSDVIDLAGVEADMKNAGFLPANETLNDNWGGIAYATWYRAGKGAPFLVEMAESGATVPDAPTNLDVFPKLDANGTIIAPGVINPDTGLMEPYTQKITWDAVPGAEGYRVWVRYGKDTTNPNDPASTADWDRLAIVPSSQTQLTHTALNVNKTFQYKVEAFNGAGFGTESTTVAATTPWDLPLPPENLVFFDSTDAAISMTWLNLADNQDGFTVWRQPVPPVSDFEMIAKWPNGIGNAGVLFVDDGLTGTNDPDTVAWQPGYSAPEPSKCYNYQVMAYNGLGDSGFNANGPVQMCTKGAPGAPGSLAATVVNATRVDLSWIASPGVVNGYRLERAGDDAFTQNLVAVDLGPDVLSYSDTTVAPAATYYYRAYAYNNAGDSPSSNDVSVTTPAAPPAAPSNLVAIPSDPGPNPPIVDLSWTDNANNEANFIVERALDNAGAPDQFTEVANLPADTTTLRDTGVEPKKTYWYRIYAQNEAGNSAYATLTIPVVTPGEAPQAPENLRVVRTSRNSVDLTWLDKSQNETGFQLERSTNGSTWDIIDIAGAHGGDSMSYTDTGLRSRTTYYYRVQAYNPDGPSAYSNTVTARTR